MKNKAWILALVGLIFIGFFHFELDQSASLFGLKSGLEEFKSMQAANPVAVVVAFFFMYVLVAALSIPGASVLTLAAGAVFGLALGTLVVSFASSIGATLAFLVSRYLFQSSVQEKFAGRLKSINAGIEKEGAFYLFTLRLLPIFPFFLINLLMGLTKISALRFYWVSQLGMLAGTLVYVNAGTQLAQLQSLSNILSIEIIFSFALLGLFPWFAKWLLEFLSKQRVYKGYKRPRVFDRNLIVIGAGAGGLVSAYTGAAVKAKVTLIEAHKMGGDCLNTGCVPSKALIKTAKVAKNMRIADSFALQPHVPEIDFSRVLGRIKTVIKAIEPHDSVARYTQLGVEVISGYATLLDPWTVQIKGMDGHIQRLSSRSIILATGAKPIVPAIPGLDAVGYLTTETLWDSLAQYKQLPKRILVLGGGPIGCELSQSFARLGSRVSQVEMAPRLLTREDEAVSALVEAGLLEDGVKVLTDHKAVRFDRLETCKEVVLEYQGKQKTLAFDLLICAVGRVARLEGYGLEALGIKTSRVIETNGLLQTRYPNIYAVGDVAGPYQFTHTAAHQAWYATVNSLFGQFKMFKVDYRVVAWVTFTDPEVARVGLNEQEAQAQGIAYEVTRYDLDDLDRAIAESATQGFVKVLTVPSKDKILGATIVGQHCGELIATFTLAMKYNLGLNKILATMHPYPSWSEANKYVAGAWRRAHAPQKLLRWVEKYHAWRRRG